ncbi:MAG: efflux RND transporter periplasmic adaptor subunit [Alphaproteobacteria bacterium]|jgi:RND family efflux transporter MFP subunit|nr:efflux RND transporter periplasmic adaptor subunit [Alphaproteobacteria bacterium]
MKKLSPVARRKIAIVLVLLPLLATFIYVGARSGPLASIPVTLAKVEMRGIAPSLFGVGTVEARYTHKIGPTVTGRIKSLTVHIGDIVQPRQLLGEMDSIDLESRVASQSAGINSAEAALRQAEAVFNYAKDEAERAEKLFPVGAVSKSFLDAKRKERRVTEATLHTAQEDLSRAKSDHDAVLKQLDNARLISPIGGMIVSRNEEMGTTVVAGQTVLEIIDPKTIWINARFDQISSSGLSGGLPAQIALRSRSGAPLKGHVLYVEPKADSVTEETLAKVIFDSLPEPLPPLGELAEVTIFLPQLPGSPAIPNAAIQRMNGKTGVWKIRDAKPVFVPVTLGAADLEGYVQVREGLSGGEQIVVYSEKALSANSRIHVVDAIRGAAR